jgi:multicomponent Na+:H+ antiporter subunit F
MNTVLNIVVILSLIMLSISLAGLVFRMIKGPSLHDKIVALDTFGVMLMGMTALVAIYIGTADYVVIMLLIGALAFISTVALAKYLERNVIIHDDRDSDD